MSFTELEPEVETSLWTDTPPTTPGYYWMRPNISGVARVEEFVFTVPNATVKSNSPVPQTSNASVLCMIFKENMYIEASELIGYQFQKVEEPSNTVKKVQFVEHTNRAK